MLHNTKIIRKLTQPKIIGIDLGTTNSCVSIMEGNTPKIIENSEGKRTTPSMVLFDKSGVITGSTAKSQMLINPKNTIFGSKRLIGKKIDDSEIQKYLKSLPFETVAHNNGDVWIRVGENRYSPSQIGAYILSKMKETAEKYLGTKIRRSVITVPAYFNDSQRQATKNAGEIAGLEVCRVINEPTAAALAYGLDKESDGIIAVYDFGGGTFDISILEIKKGIFEVKSTNGNTNLGGEDIDNEIVNYILKKFKEENGIDLNNDKIAIQRIKEAGEKVKRELSNSVEAEINLPYIHVDAAGPKHIQEKISRSKLEEIAGEIVRKTIEPCKKAIKDAGIKPSEIKHVILVGGMTRMPLVRQVVKEVFQKEPNTSVNPDEVVAKGAAIQAGVISGELSDVLLLDVASLSIGIETVGGIFSKIIQRNTTLPVKEKQIFTTSEDSQTEVDIKIYQGERPIVTDNIYLGTIKLKDITPAPKGIPRIEVVFEADANGIYKVTAIDAFTKKEQSMEIIPSGGLSKEEIEKIIKEAEEQKNSDLEKLECANFKNKAESFIKDAIDVNKKLNDKKIDVLIFKLKKSLEEEKLNISECKNIIKEVEILIK